MAARFRFGLFSADPASGELWKNGRRIHLQEQPFRVLVLLLERAGTLVSREELHKAIWASDTFVEFDQGLNTAIKKMRQALGDSPDNPRFIETVPRKGYRFIGPVAAELAAPAARRSSRRWLPAALAVAAAVIAAWLLPWRPAPALPTPVPLATYPGMKTEPSFSPDGRYVAFTWNGEREDNFDIYVKQIGVEKPLRLTADPARDFGPAWSPDGRLIAFGRVLDDRRTAVLLTSAAGGGPEVKVTEVHTPPVWQKTPFLAWSPDGKWLAVTDFALPNGQPDRSGRSGRLCLLLASAETGDRRGLTCQEQARAADTGPAFSPDGRTLAFVRTVDLAVSDLHLLALSREYLPAALPRRLDAGIPFSTSPTWSRDGTSLVFAAGPWADLRLCRIQVNGTGAAHPLEFVGDYTSCPAISRQGELAYTRESQGEKIWRIQLSAPGVAAGPAKRFLASTRIEANPRFSPDGKRVVFASNRGGFREIWIANADGTDSVPLTSMRASLTGGPNWSPDGSHVVFDSNKEGQFEVYVISAAGGTPRRLTKNPASDGVPGYSRDGDWIYFMSNRSGRSQVWRMPAAGGQAVQVTKDGGYVAEESPDGRFVYYSKAGTTPLGLWRVPPSGGEETEVLPSVTFLNFAVTGNGIYYIPRADDGQYFVNFLSFLTGTSSPIATLNGKYGNGLAVSPDGKTLLYTQIDQHGSDLMLVDSFR